MKERRTGGPPTTRIAMIQIPEMPPVTVGAHLVYRPRALHPNEHLGGRDLSRDFRTIASDGRVDVARKLAQSISVDKYVVLTSADTMGA